MKKYGALLIGALFLAPLVAAVGPSVGAGSWSGSTATTICGVMNNVRWLLEMIAGAVATLIIVINGIKWIGSSDDPGARKQAKEGIVHAVVGLVIVIVAVEIVALIYSGGC